MNNLIFGRGLKFWKKKWNIFFEFKPCVDSTGAPWHHLGFLAIYKMLLGMGNDMVDIHRSLKTKKIITYYCIKILPSWATFLSWRKVPRQPLEWYLHGKKTVAATFSIAKFRIVGAWPRHVGQCYINNSKKIEMSLNLTVSLGWQCWQTKWPALHCMIGGST